MKVRPGAATQVALPATPSTGHVWRLATRPQAVELLTEGFEAAPAPGPVAGGTGRQTFTLMVRTAGRHRLVFELRRPWEAEAIRTDEVVLEADG